MNNTNEIIVGLEDFCDLLENRKLPKGEHLKAINTFKNSYLDWKKLLGRQFKIKNGEGKQIIKDGDQEYGNALCYFSIALIKAKQIDECAFELLINETIEYENNVKYKYNIKETIYNNITIILIKKGELYRNDAIAACKRYIFYYQIQANHSRYNYLPCYAFRKCTTYLYQSLINDTIQLSSPRVFNDIFDCPIFDFFGEDDYSSKIMKDSLLQGIKVACFISNTKIPYYDNEGNRVIEVKNKHVQSEFLNPLMWAHYADSHKGICIKYGFPDNITQFGAASDSQYVSYFKDVIYGNKRLNIKSKHINFIDAFWYKSNVWKYENEIRLLYFNPYNNDTFVTIPGLNAIESIYFGVQCSEKDKETIMNILKDRKFVYYEYGKTGSDSINKIQKEKDISFFQMKKDDKIYGEIIAEKVK